VNFDAVVLLDLVGVFDLAQLFFTAKLDGSVLA